MPRHQNYNMQGIFTAIIGATIIDLTEIANCGYAAIGQVLIGLNLAMPVGSVAAGVLCGRLPRHLDVVMCLSLLSLSLSSAALPWCPYLPLMATVMAIQGISRGVATCCGNVMIIQIWKEKSSAPLHVMHFGTGFGSFIAPLMASPFLSKHKDTTTTTTLSAIGTTPSHSSVPGTNLTNITDSALRLSETKISIPYGIMAGFGILCSVAFVLFYLQTFKCRPQKSDANQVKGRGMESPQDEHKERKTFFSTFCGSCAKGDGNFGLLMAVFIFFFYTCVAGLMMSYPTYLLPVVVRGRLHLTKQQGTYLTSGYWGSFAAGRLFTAVAAKWVPARVMFLVELATTLVTSCLLAFHGSTSLLLMWIYTCAFAFLSSSLFPSGIAWSEQYLDVNGPLMAVLQSGVGFGSFLSSWLGGYGVEHVGSNFPLLLNFSFAVGGVMIYVLMQIRATCHGTKSSSITYGKFHSEPIKLTKVTPGIDSYM